MPVLLIFFIKMTSHLHERNEFQSPELYDFSLVAYLVSGDLLFVSSTNILSQASSSYVNMSMQSR